MMLLMIAKFAPIAGSRELLLLGLLALAALVILAVVLMIRGKGRG